MMTDIRTCYVGQHPVKGLVSHGKIVALIVDAALVAVLGVTPNVNLWVRCILDGRVICMRYNGRDYDMADTPDPLKADEIFAKEPWGTLVKPPWEQKIHNGVIICARFNGVDYDLAATSNVEYADAMFARTGWKGDIDFVRAMKTYRPFEY